MKKCKYCKEEIHQDAKTCKHCGRHQTGFLNLITMLSDTGVILTFVLFIISILQYYDSRKDRIEAHAAYDTALKVKNETLKLYNIVDSINKKLNTTVWLINQTALLSTQNAWINANVPIMGFDINRLSVKQFEKNSDALIRLLIPDSISRVKWWNETERIIHK